MHKLRACLVGWATVFVLVTGCDGAKESDDESDASAVSADKDAAGPGSGACNLACVRGKHCLIAAAGPRCVADADDMASEAGTSSTDAAASASDASSSIADAGTTQHDAGSGSGSCAATTCPVGSYCDDITGSAKCINAPSCNTVKCAAGTVCQLVAVQCIRAPCPAQPQCVASASDAGVACGKQTCAQGQRCCSASCGICGSASGACPAIACVPDTQN